MQEIFLLFIQVLDASIRLAVPLILASIAGLFSERSGIVDIGLEGKMLAACFVFKKFSVSFKIRISKRASLSIGVKKSPKAKFMFFYLCNQK